MSLILVNVFCSAIWWSLVAAASLKEGCESIQYIEIGTTSALPCSFGHDFYGVVWYDSPDHVTKDPILQLKEGKKSGPGFDSGEFDIYPNGSLVLTNVSFKHEHTFSVIKFDFEFDIPHPHLISVKTTVTPSPDFPEISECGIGTRACYKNMKDNVNVSCHIVNARPQVDIHWVSRTVDGDTYMNTQVISYESNSVTYSSSATVTISTVSTHLLSLAVCKANSSHGILRYEESTILFQNDKFYKPPIDPVITYVEEGSQLELHCAKENVSISYLVWRELLTSNTVSLAWSILIGENITKVISEDFQLSNRGSLKFQHIGVYQESVYECIYSDGHIEKIAVYDVKVYVKPNPNYPFVTGCTNDQYCTLEVESEGSLTCSLLGIRPEIHLQWATFDKHNSRWISFFDEQLTVKSNKDTFDITLTSTYRLHNYPENRLTIECKTLSPFDGVHHLSTQLDLLFHTGPGFVTEKSTSSSKEPDLLEQRTILLYTVLPVILVLVCIVIVIVAVMRQRRKYRRITKDYEAEEMSPILPSGCKTTYDLFLAQLKATYENLYTAVRPIPYIRDRLFGVDEIFVQGRIEISSSVGDIKRHKLWTELHSYHNIVDDEYVKYTRSVIEGEPGHGKTTLALKFAYDWCNQSLTSPLKDVEILIFLRLRQLANVISIYQAVKLYLLPKDSELTVDDIEHIIKQCSKLVLILDGYDEFSGGKDTDNDIKHILLRNMFQQFKVILTTRPTWLPTELAPKTVHIRLAGFDENARDEYLRKAVVGDDEQAVEKIHKRLGENPILGDFCQIPLFFAMYAHMTYEMDDNITFDSVTSFFRYIIASFHSHLKNKEPHLHDVHSFETDHQNMDRLAYDGLSKGKEKINWTKEELVDIVGQGFYDHYVKLGTLAEEVILSFDELTYVQERVQVRFHHKLFCEWYAAHYLSKLSQEVSESEFKNMLKELDPFNLQYVYRFTSGLNSSAADMILRYLKSTKDGDKFAILCLVEQKGSINDIKNTVKDLCVGNIVISREFSGLLQRSTIQLLDIASRINVPVECVYLENCFNVVDLTRNCIILKSDLHLPNLATVEKLRISEMGRELDCKEASEMLRFFTTFKMLNTIKFECCMMPQSFQESSVLADLTKKGVEVLWIPVGIWYRLNHLGLWEELDAEITIYKAEYETELKRFREEWSNTT